MIRGFRNKGTEQVFLRKRSRILPVPLQRIALRKLLVLNAAVTLDDLKIPPGNRLEKLRGDRSGQYSIRINDQYRICFGWSAGDSFDVEITDYHS